MVKWFQWCVHATSYPMLAPLQQTDSPETQTIALKALQLVLTSVPVHKASELPEASTSGAEQAVGAGAARLRISGGALVQQQQPSGRRMVQVGCLRSDPFYSSSCVVR